MARLICEVRISDEARSPEYSDAVAAAKREIAHKLVDAVIPHVVFEEVRDIRSYSTRLIGSLRVYENSAIEPLNDPAPIPNSITDLKQEIATLKARLRDYQYIDEILANLTDERKKELCLTAK